LMLPSVLLMLRPGVVLTGVVSPAVVLVAPLAMVALLTIWVVPAETGVTTRTTKMAEPEAPPARLPMFKVQVVPAAAPLAQLQPTVLPADLKVVLAEIGRAHVELQSLAYLVCRLLLEKKKRPFPPNPTTSNKSCKINDYTQKQAAFQCYTAQHSRKPYR